MNVIEFSKREKLGKTAKTLLKDGLAPCVVYNAKAESFAVAMDLKLAESLLATATSTTIFDGKLDGKNVKVVLKDIDRSPLTGQVRHLSFFQIDENQPMLFSIPFNIIGVSPAVKNNLGILVKALPALSVKCKLADLVPQIDIDISVLEHPGQTISVSDIALPNGMTLPNDEQSKSAIVTITQLQKVEDEVPVATTTDATTTDGAAAPNTEAAAEPATK